ncbi:hypothetical protein MPER_04330 [Moniliophthora perniciosa FA553]|nr:hypothetical protein MPER_04330 [Moniliophthora perniciosa FA553]
MLFKNILFTTAFAVIAAASPLSRRETVLPPFTSPTTGTVWVWDQKVTITCEQRDLSKATGDNTAVTALNLTSADRSSFGPATLLKTVDLTKGQAEINAPSIKPGFYFLTLVGDSTTDSNNFCITNKAENTAKDCPTQA